MSQEQNIRCVIKCDKTVFIYDQFTIISRLFSTAVLSFKVDNGITAHARQKEKKIQGALSKFFFLFFSSRSKVQKYLAMRLSHANNLHLRACFKTNMDNLKINNSNQLLYFIQYIVSVTVSRCG